MNLTFISLIVAALAAYAYADPQFVPGYYPNSENFRANYPHPSVDANLPNEGRFLFTTITATLATTTTFTTTTSTVTCTTSTSALSVCTSSGGRRRRGALLGNKKEGRGLFYEEQESEDGSIFLPSVSSPENEKDNIVAEPSREVRQSLPIVPLMIQPGFKSSYAENGRFLLAFGTSTITSTTTTVTTTSLTAICKSTTVFQLCGSSGK